MIQIVTNDGISLDLAPDAEFVIEYNNPMMEDDRIPVPFSTSIALLPSATNCKVFQYLPALKLEPVVKKISVSLVLNGSPFLAGTLSYDGIEDGALNYTFAGKNLEDDWEAKIWETNIYSYKPTVTNQNAILNGDVDGVFCPLLLNKENTGYFCDTDQIAASSEARKKISPTVEKFVKYHNAVKPFRYSSGVGRYLGFTPAVLFSKIVGSRISSYSDDITVFLPYLAVVGQYGLIVKDDVDEIGSHLPDMSMIDFVLNMNRMFCSAVFDDGGKLVMKSFASVMSQNPVADWSDKVSDGFSSGVECANGYSFGYANSDEETANDKQEWAVVENVSAVLYCSLGVLGDTPLIELFPVRDKTSGKVFSNKSSYVSCYTDTQYSTKKWMLVAAADVIFSNNMKRTGQSVEGDAVENTVDFNLVRCVPAILNSRTVSTDEYNKGTPCAGTPWFSMASIIEPAAGDAENGSTLYVGLVNHGQLTDDGISMPSSVPGISLSDNKFILDGNLDNIPLTSPDGERISITTDWLFSHFHKSYAQWLARDRQVLTCDVNLNGFDLLNFRMYGKIRIHGREFLVRKLSVTFRSGSDAVECSADFISA